MRIPWRALPAMLLLTAGLLPIAHASAGWACTYYQWDANASRWQRVALLQDEDVYEAQPGHARYQSWDCKYCTVPVIVARPPDGSSVLDAVEPLANQAARQAGALAQRAAPLVDPARSTVASLAAINPFNGPACPPVPPEWDGV